MTCESDANPWPHHLAFQQGEARRGDQFLSAVTVGSIQLRIIIRPIPFLPHLFISRKLIFRFRTAHNRPPCLRRCQTILWKIILISAINCFLISKHCSISLMSRCPQSKMFAVGLYPVCDSDRLSRVSRGWGKEDLALSFQIRGRPLPTHGNCPNPTFPLLQKLIGTPKLWNRDPTFCEIGTPSSQNRDPKQRFMKFNTENRDPEI